MKVQITLNENQVTVIQSALDLYSRLLMGQFEELDRVFCHYSDYWEKYDNRKHLNKLCEDIKHIIYPELTGASYFGVGNKNNPMDSKVAYDIYQVVRHALSWHKEPQGGYTVNFNTPVRFGKEELCEVNINK